MIIIDSSGQILFANRQVSALFGYAAEELVGGPIETLLPERFRARHVGHRSSYANSVRVRPMGIGLELFGMRKDGTEFPVEISLSPIKQGNDIRVAAAIRDVTERKEAEKALKEARREAEHANLAKSRFLATASHDLRQPLQTLGLLSGALRRMNKDEEYREILREQELAVDAMSRLLNALLDISKLESGAIKLALTDFDMDALFEQLRRDFAGVASNKGLQLAIEKPHISVHSDPALVGQLLRNLLSNAIKYTQHGTVELHCEIGGGKLRVAVRDTGVGIAPDQVGLIFDEFYQIGVTPNSSRDGYGLGLSIVQRIARLLDLKVKVESDLGKGSRFSFELPAADSPRSAVESRVSDHSSSEKMVGNAPRILLVEDEPGVRNAMRMLLDIEGYHVTTAATTEEALQLVRGSNAFNLLITDYHLEDGNTGTQVIAAARGILGESFKAILVTGDTSSAVRDMQGDMNLRMASKPINPDELLALVKALLAA
jgi:PAS domain S-box-containing protein